LASTTERIHYGWVILAVGTLVVYGALGLARFGYSMLLPAMQTGLHMDNTHAGALATANLIGYLTLSVLGGALAAHYGPRKVIAAGLAVVGAAMFMTGFSNGFADAVLWRFLTGLGSGASNVPVMALLAAWFAQRRRGTASGICVAGSSLALISLGPAVPGVLQAYGENGWRVCWCVFGGVTVLLALASFLLLRDRPSQMSLLPIGSDLQDIPSPPATTALAWGTVYRSLTVWHLGLVYAACGFSYIIYMTFFVKHLITAGGYESAAAGRLFMTMGWFSVVCGLLWGAVSDVIGRKHALIVVYLTHTASFAIFSLWQTPAGFTVSAVLFGLTAWSIPAIMAATCGDLLGSRLAPAGLGFITLFFGVGQAVGPSVAGIMSDATGSLAPSFLLAAGVAFLGAMGSALLRQSSLRISDSR
jgi:MFS family permease